MLNSTSMCYTYTMELRQKIELRKILAPELRQSLKVLTLPLLDLKQLIENELVENPFLEETPTQETLDTLPSTSDDFDGHNPESIVKNGPDIDLYAHLLTKKASLQDVLLRQLGIFANTDEELKIGKEIIGNIEENGYLKATLEEIAGTQGVTTPEVEKVLKLVQRFEPAGVGARTTAECLLIQLELGHEKDPLLKQIVECHLEDLAKKNYSLIAKSLKEPPEKIEPLIKKILKLDPKPGRNYSAEETQRIIPDIIIEEKEDNLEITINKENLPPITINKVYRDMLKKPNLDPQTKEFLTNKLRHALELLRAIAKRQTTLRKVIDKLVEIQREAILQEDPSLLRPLTFQGLAKELDIHESTVCRVVMNKYVKMPYGMVALKDLFTSHIHDENGQSVSSNYIKILIKELIDEEDKKHPLSDEEILKILSQKNQLQVARRTVAKYREELKILSSTYRKER